MTHGQTNIKCTSVIAYYYDVATVHIGRSKSTCVFCYVIAGGLHFYVRGVRQAKLAPGKIKMTGRKWKVASKWVRNWIAFSANKVQSAKDKVCN